jgi:hypothetical protein
MRKMTGWPCGGDLEALWRSLEATWRMTTMPYIKTLFLELN